MKITTKTTAVKHAAGKARLAIPVVAILLAVGPAPAEAGLLDTVNSRVKKGETLGKLLGIVGEGALVVVASANKIVEPCIKQKLEQIALLSNG